ncbi:MAG TPA: hypothetical protein VN442_03540 [Bryobacteraceae bacterium]|nr:hypothetical protein [Bryobacteraceae bacterium]
MAFCATCGAPVEGSFCAKCGTPAGAAAGMSAGGPAANTQTASAQTGGLSENAASALSYVLGFITGILFLVIAPYNQIKTVRFHAFQSIFLNVAWIAVWIAMTIVGTVLSTISFMLATLWGLVSLLLSLGMLVLWIFMIVKAYQGSKVVLPIVGPLAEKQA